MTAIQPAMRPALWSGYDWVDRVRPENRLLTGKSLRVVKRAFDIAVVLAAAPLWVPLLLICAALVKLDLPSNPSAYVLRRCDADASGNLVVTVKNNTSVQITGVQVAVSYADQYGRQRQVSHAIRGQIPPGQVASVSTGLGPYTQGSDCPAEVIAARIAE